MQPQIFGLLVAICGALFHHCVVASGEYNEECAARILVKCAECQRPLSDVIFAGTDVGEFLSYESYIGVYDVAVPCTGNLSLIASKSGFRHTIIGVNTREASSVNVYLYSVDDGGLTTIPVQVAVVADCGTDHDIKVFCPDVVGPVTSQNHLFTLHVCSLPVVVTVTVKNETLIRNVTSTYEEVYFVCEFPCGPVPEVPHATYDPIVRAPVGTIVNILCDVGYFIKGTIAIACQPDERWSDTPQCVEDCGDRPVIAHGVPIDQSDTTIEGAHVVYWCNKFYSMSGRPFVRCSSGSWSILPSCKKVCDPVPGSLNAIYTSPTAPVEGAVVRYTCFPGHSTVDPTLVTCQQNGTWYPATGPSCIKIYATCKDGWTHFNGSCYRRMNLLDKRSAFNDIHCPQAWSGAHVVRPETEGENTFVKTYLATFTGPGYYLDVVYDVMYSTWVYKYRDPDLGTTQTVVAGFVDWAEGKPDQRYSEVNAIYRRDLELKWDDVMDENYDAVCEHVGI